MASDSSVKLFPHFSGGAGILGSILPNGGVSFHVEGKTQFYNILVLVGLSRKELIVSSVFGSGSDNLQPVEERIIDFSATRIHTVLFVVLVGGEGKF